MQRAGGPARWCGATTARSAAPGREPGPPSTSAPQLVPAAARCHGTDVSNGFADAINKLRPLKAGLHPPQQTSIKLRTSLVAKSWLHPALLATLNASTWMGSSCPAMAPVHTCKHTNETLVIMCVYIARLHEGSLKDQQAHQRPVRVTPAYGATHAFCNGSHLHWQLGQKAPPAWGLLQPGL